MFNEKGPFFSDEFLNELVKEINQQFGGPQKEQMTEPLDNNDSE